MFVVQSTIQWKRIRSHQDLTMNRTIVNREQYSLTSRNRKSFAPIRLGYKMSIDLNLAYKLAYSFSDILKLTTLSQYCSLICDLSFC